MLSVLRPNFSFKLGVADLHTVSLCSLLTCRKQANYSNVNVSVTLKLELALFSEFLCLVRKGLRASLFFFFSFKVKRQFYVSMIPQLRLSRQI